MADQGFHKGWQVFKAAFLAKFVQNWLFSWNSVYISALKWRKGSENLKAPVSAPVLQVVPLKE